MKLSKLYSNKSDLFEPIIFNDNLNIVLVEVRRPENKMKSSHSLGKSLLASLIDHCLLKTLHKEYFLKKHDNLFSEFIFFLEIKIGENNYCTIRRSVEKNSKIYIKKHLNPHQDYTILSKSDWDNIDGFKKSKLYLDNLLFFNVIPKFEYRKSISYFLRDPNSFGNVFKLSKHKGKDREWKPVVAELMGFDSDPIKEKYELDNELKNIKDQQKNILEDEYEISKQKERLNAVLFLKEDERKRKEKEFDSFNFVKGDIEKPEILANDIEKLISELVKENYYLNRQIEYVKSSIVDYNVDLTEIEDFYHEIKVYFSEQLKKDYNDLIEFNTQILRERNEILKEFLLEYTSKLSNNEKQISDLNKKRSKTLEYIRATESFEKFKLLQNVIVEINTEIQKLKDEISSLTSYQKFFDKNITIKIAEKIELIRQEIFRDNEYIKSIKKHFNNIILNTLGDAGVISTPINKEGNVEFVDEIIDTSTKSTSSKDKGTTYKKLMCCAFDLALLATYFDKRFFHFTYHDGVFDGLDDRQKENYYKVINMYCEKYDMQYIFTSIQDQLPISIRNKESIEELKDNKTIIKLLHDEGNDGRLFKMDAF